jgi:hypothetical protein
MSSGDQLLLPKPRDSLHKKHRAVVRYSTMSDVMQREAIDVSIAAVDECSSHAEAAMRIQTAFAKKYAYCHWWEFGRRNRRNGGNCWQCIVGRDIGSYVLRPAGHYIKLDIDQLTVILFKSQ